MTRIVIWLKGPDGNWRVGARSEPFDMAAPDVHGVQVEFQTLKVAQADVPVTLGQIRERPFDGVTPLTSTVAGRKQPPPPGQEGGG